MTDRVGLLRRLVALSPRALEAYATACVGRVLPAYERRSGHVWGVPHNTVDLAWSVLGGAEVIRQRWHRLRAFNERNAISIDDHGPDYATQNAVAAGARLLCEIFGFASSGDPTLDHRERARRALLITGNARDAIEALHRETLRIDPHQVFTDGPEVEQQWQVAALEALERSRDPRPDRAFFARVDVQHPAGWYPWTHPAPATGPDLTLFAGAFTREPKPAYFIHEAENHLSSLRVQAMGAEVAFVREVARVNGVARFSYHLRKQHVTGHIELVLYHVLAGEFLRHDFDDCREIRFRDLDTDARRTIPYPPHSLADDDMDGEVSSSG